MIINLTIFLHFFIEDNDICPAMRVYLGKKPLIEETLDDDLDSLKVLLKKTYSNDNINVIDNDFDLSLDNVEFDDDDDSENTLLDSEQYFELSPPIQEINRDCLSEHEIQIIEELLDSNEYKSCKCFRDQVKFICNSTRNEIVFLSYRKIGHFFGKNKGTIKKQYELSNKGEHINGRPRILNEDQTSLIHEFIRNSFIDKVPVSFLDVCVFIDSCYNIQIQMDTIRHIVYCWKEFKIVDGKPMETERVMCDSGEIDDYFCHLENLIHDIDDGFIYNIDETGFQDWTDRRDKRIIVPSDYELDSIPICVNRNSKRLTTVACINIDGSSLKPLIISERKTVEIELSQIGYSDNHFLIKFQENGFISTEIFNEWAYEIFFPDLMRKRIEKNYLGLALLLLDGCSCHISDYFLDLCTEYGVEPVFLPAHSSDQTQPLDLVIFGVMKMIYDHVRPDKNLNPQTKEIIRIHSAWISASTPYNVTQAFRKAGICR